MHRTLALNEVCRQAIHIGSGFLAFGVRWLGIWPLALVALAATLFNAWLLPRIGGRWLWRRGERERGRAVGMVLYPLTVLALLLVFARRPEVAAAGWGLLAFGDGFASLVGQGSGKRRLPWNPAKSWAGLIAFWLAGWIAVAALLQWTAPGRHAALFLWLAAGSTALLAALLESAPQRLDDNLGVPLVASLWLICLLGTEAGWAELAAPGFWRWLAIGLVINATLAIAAFAGSLLSPAGAVVGCWLGTLVFGFAGWRGFLILAFFFALGSTATRLGIDRKSARRLAEPEGGRRGPGKAVANGGVAAACALFAGLTTDDTLFTLALVGALAAAAADTVESEIGQLWGRPTVLITSLRPVEPGTDGGVSPIGSLAGLTAAALIVTLGWALQLFPVVQVLPLTLLSLAATLLESLAGATLERRGLLDNNGVNFLNTLLGALFGAALAWSCG